MAVGRISRPHGIVGEVKVQTAPEFADALRDVKRVLLRFPGSDEYTPYKVRGYRPHQGSVLLKFIKVVTRNDSEALRGAEVYIDVKELPKLPDGEYYTHDLIGMAVRNDADDAPIGQIEDVLATGSNDVYVVRKTDGTELLLPVIESVVRQINPVDRVIRVTVMDGLE